MGACKRFFDILLVIMVVPWVLPLLGILFIVVKLNSKGPFLYWSKRVGVENKIFLMPKIRTMKVGTPQLATHLMDRQNKAQNYLTSVGRILRKLSLDEIPQLWSILVGDMTWVGPRPALFNQDDLVAMRTEVGVHHLTPGLTGLAQINGRDDLSLELKVRWDRQYQSQKNFWLDLKILCLTALKVLKKENVGH